MGGVLFRNATLVLSQEVRRGAVLVRDGVIADILDHADHGRSYGDLWQEDLDEDFLCPGLIELHTDNLERHLRPRPGVFWPHAAAVLAHDGELASAGITTVFDALWLGAMQTGDRRGDPYARAVADVLVRLRGQGALRLSHHLHLRAEICSETLLDELAQFGAGDGVGLVSVMDHTPGQRQYRDRAQLALYFKGKYGMSDAECADYMDELCALRAAHGDAHCASVVDFANRMGAVLASHDDTTPAEVAASRAYGVRLAEFPTTIEAARACHQAGIKTIMGAPNLIRGGSHSGNVAAQDLATAGLLDIVSSDYVPSALLDAALWLGDLWGDMAKGLATVTATPAAAVGLADRGAIVSGARADLIRFARLNDGTGHPIGVMRETWVAGRRVF